MAVAGDIILISAAIQSNGILTYTLNIFKTKHLLKSTQLFTRSVKLVATALKIYWQPEIALPKRKGKMICTCATLNEMRMPRTK